MLTCLTYKLVATPGQGCCLTCLCTTNTYRTCASPAPSTFLKLTDLNVVPRLRTFCTTFRYKSQCPTPFISRLLSRTLPCVCQGDGRSLIPLTSHPPMPAQAHAVSSALGTTLRNGAPPSEPKTVSTGLHTLPLASPGHFSRPYPPHGDPSADVTRAHPLSQPARRGAE